MTESEEVGKLIDGAYKNILEKFNPCARQLISTGKSYLKALHGAVTASKSYLESITKLARCAHQGTWGGCTDIGTALMQLVDVQKEVQAQQINILKAFYVDLLVPLETNLEKDCKVVANEHKQFQHLYKSHQEAYQKAAASVKKQKKKKRNSKTANVDKEIKHMQIMDEEKSKLDGFCEHRLKQVITQERRRYGFVLERQCSLIKHYLAYYTKGQSLLNHHLAEWEDVVRSRESLPRTIENMFVSSVGYLGNGGFRFSLVQKDPDIDDRMSVVSRIRKTRSIDASCLDIRELDEDLYPQPLFRAKSDFNLTSSSASLSANEYVPDRHRSMLDPGGLKGDRPQVRALYSYLSSGDHQLSFHEGDVITLIGERNKGWQYGENTRNHRCGWFPIAYTTSVVRRSDSDEASSSSERRRLSSDISTPLPSSDESSGNKTIPSRHQVASDKTSDRRSPMRRPLSSSCASPVPDPEAIPTMLPRPLSTFVDGLYARVTDISKLRQGPPPAASTSLGEPSATSVTVPITIETAKENFILRPPQRSLTSPLPLPQPVPPPPRIPPSTSLYSSHDSGFSNDIVYGGKVPEVSLSSPRDNVFASVKLRKVTTNDRSAPRIT
ncbi:insulin receptor substrate 53 kDa isoform X2 [Tachypleus tridentatus]|uniref:insulin receptor substrate 53 kDa isoform X2 n=1 Tax=Tachypleus tridentatus TaxID=6853 RepID=UPI003FD42567